MTRSLDFDITGKDVPRDLFPEGRVKFSLAIDRSTDPRDQRARDRRSTLRKLRRWHGWDILHAISEGELHPATVEAAIERNGEGAVREIRNQLERDRAGAIPTVEDEAGLTDKLEGDKRERYLEWYERERAPSSLKQVRSRLNRFAEQVVNGRRMGERTMSELQNQKSDVELAIRQVSDNPSTQEAIRLAVSGLFTWSIDEEAARGRQRNRAPRWSLNPGAAVERRERRPRIRTATEEQVLQLFAAAEIYQRAYLRAFLHLGLRLTELTHTRLHDDLDVNRWTWKIQPHPEDDRCGCIQCREGGGGWSPKGYPRSSRAVRTLMVPTVPVALRLAITDYLDVSSAEPGDFVFRNPRTGGVWDSGALQGDFERLCERAEVRYGRNVAGGLTPHDLRHTCATELVRRGVRESIIAGLLGDTVETIVNTYVNLTPDDLADAVAAGPTYDLETN